jgi:sodium--glutamate symport carrier gltS
MRDACLVVFFTTSGLSAKPDPLRAGGKPLDRALVDLANAVAA